MKIEWTRCADEMPPDNDDEIIYNNTITNKFYHGTASWFRFTQSIIGDIHIYKWCDYTPEKWREVNKWIQY